MARMVRWVVMLGVTLAMPLQILACGISLIPDGPSWTYGNDGAEQSFINYEHGQESLIISRNFDNDTESAVWVVPLPAAAQAVKVDVISDTPNFTGYEITKKASENFDSVKKSLLATQFYPMVPYYVMGTALNVTELADTNTTGFGAVPLGGIMGKALPPEVTVYQHLEKNGMTAEVLSAVNSDALYQYLHNKGLTVQKDAITVLQPYIGKNFSFVATWVSVEGEHSVKGVLMNFPANKMFYPLYPESVYPGAGFPETITVVGHVSPDLFLGIKANSQVNYYHSDEPTSLDQFFTTREGYNFTKIVVRAQPTELTQDLYISSIPPLKILQADLLALHPLVSGIVVMIAASFIAALLALILLGFGINPALWLKLGACGSLTLIGTIVGSRWVLPNKRFWFVFVHSVSFVVIILAYSAFITYLYP